MPLYIPWLTETIKKRGVRYLLHHYLGQFFEEKLTLEQLSIDIYEGRGSIRNLALDVDGLNDELDFIPFKFLDGCLIGQISVEVPWSSLATEACKVELEGAKFVCRLKTSADGSKAHCTESTLLTRSLMTSSMQMAEDIVTTEDDEEYDSQTSSVFSRNQRTGQDSSSKRKDASQMLEGLEMFAQLIDSVLRRTKLTARNTLFQIQPHSEDEAEEEKLSASNHVSSVSSGDWKDRSTSGDEYADPASKSDTESSDYRNSSEGTVEFLIKFFRCEEIIDQSTRNESDYTKLSDHGNETQSNKLSSAMPETITKLLTLEDVEMRIGGIPVSNLIGKHTIMIKFNGQKSEISIFSGSPLLAVIGHEQLKTFFNVFDSTKEHDNQSSPVCEKNQKVMSPEDYAKIENQLLESASLRTVHQAHMSELGYVGSSNLISSQSGGQRWVDSGELYSDRNRHQSDYDYHSPNSSSTATCLDGKESETTLDNIEAFSCELKLPGIWLCILKDGEALPPLIKPYADSINSFQTINKYIEERIKVPHIRFLALKVALDITSSGINVHLGDLDISEHLQNDSMNPTLHLVHNDLPNLPMNSPRYKAHIVNNKEINVELLTKTRILFDPTMIDRIVYDYKLIDLEPRPEQLNELDCMTSKPRSNRLDLSLTIRGEQFKVELLCPIPDLTPEAQEKLTQLRPQSFLFDFRNIVIAWQLDKLNVSAREFTASVKTQPKQSDNEAVKFIESSSKNNDKIVVILEPSPSNLDTAFPNDIEQALNESSLYDSIYVGQTTESRIPNEAFRTKRKVVRASLQQSQSNSSGKQEPEKSSGCDNEKILTPGDRQHLLDYLNQTVMSTKMSLSIHLPVCEVEFEDKEQLDLIYNRFGNDFVFWQPKAFSKSKLDNFESPSDFRDKSAQDRDRTSNKYSPEQSKIPCFKQPLEDSSPDVSDQDSEVSFHSLSVEGSGSDCYDNEITCKIIIDELFIKFNHQSCASAMKQEISVENLLMGAVIDVNKKPGTILSLVADNLELSTDSIIALEGNSFGDKNSILSMTAEIKRPTKALKDIKLAVQLVNGLFNDFKIDTYNRFWQSINVTDEPILGYIAPKIVTELHIDILNTALSLVREGARPALLSIDELYLTSMVMEQTSQVMIRMIADEVSLYLKRNKQGLEVMKNYICLIDSGLIDLDIKFSHEGQLEFGVINNVITVRVCQDSLSALCKLFNVIIRSSDSRKNDADTTGANQNDNIERSPTEFGPKQSGVSKNQTSDEEMNCKSKSSTDDENEQLNKAKSREINLLEDAMNDYSDQEDGLDTDNKEVSNDDDEEEEEEEEEDEDSDSPPVIQTTSECHRDPNACLLDESNPLIDDFFSPPLLPSSGNKSMIDSSQSFNSSDQRAVDESGFFVIGDDDVGAGIMDKMRQEPVVRKLTERPINIIENHFKMTKPRTIPELLASSLERYVLEEMTLVVNLYGGRDFDDENANEDSNGSTNATSNQDQDSEVLDTISMESGSFRSRASSVACGKKSPLSRKQCSSDSNQSSLKKKGSNRRKHLSEGSRDLYKGGSIEPRVRFGEGAVNLWESLDLMSSPDFLGSKKPSQPPLSSETKIAGGTWRQTDVCIQLTLSKVKLLYEIGSEASPNSWRFMLFIDDIEIKDRIHASDINKMLYEYCTESMPKRNTQMLTIKNIATINPSDGCEECDLRVSLKPLRLNIDQDTLLFLIEFFTSFSKVLSKQQSLYSGTPNTSRTASSSKLRDPSGGDGGLKDSSSINCRQNRADGASCEEKRATGSSSSTTPLRSGVRSQGIAIRKRQSSERSDTSLSFGSCSSTASSSAAYSPSSPNAASLSSSSAVLAPPSSVATTTTTTLKPAHQDDQTSLPTHCHTDNSGSANQPIYIKSFTFSPDVPIRLDYHAKHLDFEQGALAGILMGLAHLDHSELVLKRVQAKHGMRGLDRVLLFTLNSWMSDIKRNQLPSILSGVGPMHSVIQLFQGMRDLIWMPIDHYRKDRRLVRGLQRGASSFSSSTAMAAINLMNRFISIVQCTAQIAHDIVTPPAFQSSSNRRSLSGASSSGLASGGGGGGGGSRRNRDSYKSAPTASTNSSNLSKRHHHHHHRHRNHAGQCSSSSSSSIVALNQPRNFCEGVAVGFTILKEGFNDTARNVAVGMQADDVRGAVGELVRQIPSTLLNPILSATEGAQNVLVGIRNQIAPDARREDQEKWKRRVRGK